MIMEHEGETYNRSQELCRRVVTTESFIAEAKEIYGDRYDYSKVDYKNREHKVTIICPVHGEFQVYAREHLDGKGCPKCAKGEKFVSKLKEKFGDKFGLEKFVYQSSTTPVTLVCPTHGEFTRLPLQILNSTYGCPKCYKDLVQQKHEEALKKAEEKKEEERKAIEQQQKAYNAYLAQERAEQEKKRRDQLKDYKENPNPYNSDVPFRVYWSEIHDIIYDIRYHGDWGRQNVSPYILKDEEAQTLSYYREGDTYYKFPDKAPTDEIRKSFEGTFSQYGKTLEEYIAVGNCIIHSEGKDLIIQEESSKYVQKRDEVESKETSKTSYLTKDLPTSFVSIDFETLYAQRVSVCSVGMVKYREGLIVDRFYTLIRPPFDYPGKKGQELSWIHGITKEMLVDKKTFSELLPSIEAFIDGLPLIAHNASVERNCFKEACAYYKKDTKIDYNSIIDTLALSKKAEEKANIQVSGSGTHSLDELCKRFGVEVKQHHNALDDAEMCGNLFLIFKKILDEGYISKNHIESNEDAHICTQSSNDVMPQPTELQTNTNNSGCLGITLLIAIAFLILLM